MKQFEKEVLKRTNELNILNWSVLILTFWLAISILLCINIKYREHSCTFSLNGKCYPAKLHCKNTGSGHNAYDGIDSLKTVQESLEINPSSECSDETIIIKYPSASGTSTVTLDLNFTTASLPSGSTEYTKNDYSGNNIGYKPIVSSGISIGVSIYLNYFSGVSPWIDSSTGTSSIYLGIIQDVITTGMESQVTNRVIKNDDPLPYINTSLDSGIIVNTDNINKTNSIDIIAFKDKDVGVPTSQELEQITSNQTNTKTNPNKSLFGNIDSLNPKPLQNLINEDIGHDPYAALILTNQNLIDSGCKSRTEPNGNKCPCLDPSINVLPSFKKYPEFSKSYNRYCVAGFSPSNQSEADGNNCVPYVDFTDQTNSSGDTNANSAKSIMTENKAPGPPAPGKESLYNTKSDYYFGPKSANKKIDNVDGYSGDQFQTFAYEPTKNFCATQLGGGVNNRVLYERGENSKKNTNQPESIARSSKAPNSQIQNGKIALGFPGSGLGENGNGGLD